LDLVPAELGLFAFAGHNDRAANGIDLNSAPERRFSREKKYLREHFDYVVVGMVVIIEQHDVEQRRKFLEPGGVDLGRDGRLRHDLL